MEPKTARASATPAPKPPLSLQRITEAALAQIDQRGLDAWSLRDVARSLGVYPTAIYWYVAGKNQLLSEVCALAMRTVTPPRRKGRWQDWLRELFRRYRKAMRQHPNLAQLVGARLVSNSSLDASLVEGVLEALEQAGCPDDCIVDAYNTVIAAMCGFVTLELAQLPGDDVERWRDELQQRVRRISALEHPTLARHLPALANKSFILRWQGGGERPMERSFEAFVETFVGGLELRIPEWRAATTAPLAAGGRKLQNVASAVAKRKP